MQKEQLEELLKEAESLQKMVNDLILDNQLKQKKLDLYLDFIKDLSNEDGLTKDMIKLTTNLFSKITEINGRDKK